LAKKLGKEKNKIQLKKSIAKKQLYKKTRLAETKEKKN
jgi:hypothetical protein